MSTLLMEANAISYGYTRGQWALRNVDLRINRSLKNGQIK